MPGELSLPAVTVSGLSLPTVHDALPGLGHGNGPTVSAGMVSFDIPLSLPVARESAPALTLGYSAGAGNGPCGNGWQLDLPAIQRRTRLGVPQYNDDDVFVGPDGEPLVPQLGADGKVVVQTGVTRCVGSTLPLSYSVTRYSSRTLTDYSRYQYWQSGASAFWLWFERSGVIHCLGYTAQITDPASPGHIARWLIEESLFPNGEHVLYRYVAEDSTGISDSRDQTAQRYPDRIDYANLTASPTFYLFGTLPDDAGWLRTLKFDYGQRPADDQPPPTWDTTGVWACRPDAFSDYRFGFELRSHRLCRQLLAFGRDPASPATPTLLSCLSFSYDSSVFGSALTALRRRAYEADGSLLDLPATRFSYTAGVPAVDGQYQPLAGWAEPPGYQLVDLYGDGLPGLLYQQAGAWLYRAPQRVIGADPDSVSYGQATALPQAPKAVPGARQLLLDMTGDGRLDWVSIQPGLAGFFALNDDHSWRGFTPFSAFPAEFLQSGAQLANLVGNGRLDLVLIGPNGVRLYANTGSGFAAPVNVACRNGPLPVPGRDARELVAFADVLGVGSPQLLRVTFNQLTCWPDLGRGAFGAPLTFALDPLDSADAFNPARLFLADVGGSGGVDLLYAKPDGLRLYRNQAGNGFDSPLTLPWPDGFRYDDSAELRFGDLAGHGAVSLLLSQRHGEPKHWRYDFLSGPAGLLSQIDNQCGRTIQLSYRSSAQFRLDEKRSYPASVSHLPLTLALCSQVVDRDAVQGHADTRRYAYQGGLYDPTERTFNGFRRVDRSDQGDAYDGYGQPLVEPALTRSWYHTGQPDDATDRSDYYAGDAQAYTLGDTRVTSWDGSKDSTPTSSDPLWHQVLKGKLLHEEVYPADISDAVPRRVNSSRWQLRVMQAATASADAVVSPLLLETLHADYDDTGFDPRFSQQVVLSRDGDGNVTRQARVHYPRRAQDPAFSDPLLTPEQLAATYDDSQQRLRLQEGTLAWTRVVDDSNWRLGLPTQQIEQALDYPASSAGSGLSFETLSDPNGLLGPDAPRTLTDWRTQSYLNASSVLLAIGRVTGQQHAVLDDSTAHSTYDPVLGSDQVATQLQAAGYVQETLNGLNYWVAQRQSASYADAGGFYRLQTLQANAHEGKRTLTYDPASCWLTGMTDALGKQTTLGYDARFWQAVSLSDVNGKLHEVRYDALGRVMAVSHSGFDPVANYLPTGLTPEQACVSASDALQGMAEVVIYAAGSWAGEIDSRLPAHRLVLSADREASDPARQIRQRMDYRDGHDRAWRTVRQVAPGDGYRLSENGDFVYDESGEAVSGPLAVRWQVAAGDECSAGGLPLLQYPGYFVDRSRPAREAPPLPFAQHYRDATRKPVLVRKADSDEQRRRFTPWYACALDENDTYLGTAQPLENLQRSFDSTRRPQIGMHGGPINWVGPKMQLYDLGGGARSYDPDIQRFLTLDPFSPFSIGGMNPYLFCSSDPVNRLDPTGYASYRMGTYGYSASAAIYAGVTGLIAGVLSILSILTMTGLILMAITLVGSLLLIVAASMQIASGVIIESDPEYGAELGDASNVLYSISGVLLVVPAANSAWGGILKIKNSTWRITQRWRNNANHSVKKLSIGSQNASFPPPRPRLARSLSASNPELGNPIVSACPKLYATLPRSPSKSIKSVSEDSIYYSANSSIADSLSMKVRAFIKLP
ncbi:SpvB/TcaC N-terminal domain-containing protein [Microvirgula aerodenitrificans]|uniref:SpvB/TcaC N-terminal domain-containing protein n=1 Tax=Microvirgula aerodenitrificans TaxID=57480 RepID=UPI002F40BBBA